VGLIKGYSWLNVDTGKIGYATNGHPDVGADQLYPLISPTQSAVLSPR
jgi:hypothetical protein